MSSEHRLSVPWKHLSLYLVASSIFKSLEELVPMVKMEMSRETNQGKHDWVTDPTAR